MNAVELVLLACVPGSEMEAQLAAGLWECNFSKQMEPICRVGHSNKYKIFAY